MTDWRIELGDCREVMRGMAEASVDAIVTDPPYGYAFMGKRWDATGVAFEPKTWEIAARVLNPGAHLVAFGGTRTYHRLACAIEDAGFEIRDCLMWIFGSGFPKSLNLDGDWKGFGTALKPAYEPIILARKPLAGTVAANVQQHGTGAINVDGCRIATQPRPVMRRTETLVAANAMAGASTGATPSGEVTSLGRWPANVLLDEEAASLLDEHSGQSGETERVLRRNGPRAMDGWGFDKPTEHQIHADYGGASRFFYTSKASSAERSAGLAERSTHPTVKPLDLMQWLCRLVTPPGGLILDPFAGSGSTVIAALREGFRCIGIEREADYAEIAQRRVEEDAPLFRRVAP